ncbi:hypothetical protein GS399_05025 [Pedobacter sp. HMF7647]|uniref:Tetratricopeptide repeat protein n=1 Tax=Hufsiella arboris TaxID=2695275 RepID=A0A7K1Y6X4_9SPHI|nr:hypothetical protein [Hufsiella arboris]MXV50326.1 hypothetical protein [Hufsiella arboris]
MKNILGIIICMIIYYSSFSQTSTGAKSPVIIGAKAKVEYTSQRIIAQKLPPTLAPYLAGLLFANKVGSDTAIINKALSTWFRKYRELKSKSDNLPDQVLKGEALASLSEGDFNRVENLLKLRTNYKPLLATFPNSFQTNGNESPIIVGDFATVTYVVKEVITYQLPESMTSNLLNELRSKDKIIGSQSNQLGDLKSAVESRETIIKSYINRYNLIKEELKKSPLEVYKRAFGLFENNNIEGALRVLDKSAGNDQAYGKTSILKAKILLLQLNSAKLDETLIKIDNAYSIGVQLSPDADNFFEYGKFLIDYLGNYLAAVPVLEKADALNMDLQKRVRILNYLGIAYSATDKVKANETHEKALSFMDTMEPLKNDDLITLRAVILYNISTEYSARFFDRATIKTAISFAQRAIEQLNRLTVSTEDSKQRRSAIQILTGREYAMINDTAQAFAYYRQALSFLKAAVINKPALYSINLSAAYYAMAEIYYNAGQPVKALNLLNQSVTAIAPRISVNSRIYLAAYEQLLTSILKNLGAMNRVPEMINYLSDLNRQLKPFIASDPNTYLLHQAWVNTDLGHLYLASRMIDSAKKYLPPAYDYYIEHLNTAQFDKDKFTTCLAQMNELMIQSGNSCQAITNNRNLLVKFTNTAFINRFAYEDLPPQIERQQARAFTVMGQKDSASKHMKNALKVMEPKAKQYGTTYLTIYFDYVVQEFLIDMTFKDQVKAEQDVQKFIKNCDIIIDIDPFVKQKMMAIVGQCISNFGVALFTFSQDPANQLKPTDNLKLFPLMSSYFTKAESYFQMALQNDPNDGVKYAMALSDAVYLENFWITQLSNAEEKHMHQLKKCDIAGKTNALIAQLPAYPILYNIRNKVQMLTADCN